MNRLCPGDGLRPFSPAHDKYDRLFVVLFFLLLAERLISFFIIGADTLADADDVAYVQSGITFARTGVISVWSDAPTALIMPATTLVTGLMSLLFGEGTAYMASVKIIWIILGSITPYFIYRAMCLYVPKPYALLCAAAFLLPNHAWVDNVISTETPYLCFFCACLYYSLRMTRDSGRACLIKYSVSFILALSFRANILIMPVFTALHLILCRRYPARELLRRAAVFCALSLIFFVPWTIRNYIRYDAFIPVSYGAANPTLKGTYQGHGYPEDSELDYETNVYDAVREKYSRYFDSDGNISDPAKAQYINSKYDEAKARYRISEWIKRDAKSFFISYFIEKPTCVLTWVYYWGAYSDVIILLLNLISKVNFVSCVLGVIMALIAKKQRGIILMLSLLYWASIYVIAMSFAVERYAAMLLPLRYMVSVIGIYVSVDFFREKLRAIKRLA